MDLSEVPHHAFKVVNFFSSSSDLTVSPRENSPSYDEFIDVWQATLVVLSLFPHSLFPYANFLAFFHSFWQIRTTLGIATPTNLIGCNPSYR